VRPASRRSTATVYNFFARKPNILQELTLRRIHATLSERSALLRNQPDGPVEVIVAFERLLSEQELRICHRLIRAQTGFCRIVGIATTANFGHIVFGSLAPSGT
jgi:hypothetical protein